MPKGRQEKEAADRGREREGRGETEQQSQEAGQKPEGKGRGEEARDGSAFSTMNEQLNKGTGEKVNVGTALFISMY